MFSDIVTTKADAKKDIQGALLGLLLIISAVLVLSTINSDLTNFDIMISPLDLNQLVVEESEGEMTDLDQWCSEGGGCEIETCEGLGISAFGAISAGAIAGTLLPIPGVNWVVGSVVGFGAYLNQDIISCSVTCAYLGGMFNDSTNNCHLQIDEYAGAIAEFEREYAEMICSYDKFTEWDSETNTCDQINDNSEPLPEDDLTGGETIEELNVICEEEYGDGWEYLGDGANYCVSYPTVTFNGESVDTSVTYIINDPANPELDVEEGQFDGEAGQVIGVVNESQVLIKLSSGDEVVIGCSLLSPPIPGC